MEITGKIVRVFEPQSGTSKAGREWKKREYLLEVPNNNSDFGPRQIFFNFFGDRADQFVLEGGKEYTVSFDIESREYNGRWYTDIRAWKAEPANGAASGSQRDNSMPPPPSFDDPLASAPSAPESSDMDSITDDLPF